MAVTPTGMSGQQLAAIRNLIAASATFQAWVGAGSAADAAKAIYLDAFRCEGDDLSEYRPFALIQDAGQSHEAIAGGTRNHFASAGTFVVVFEEDVPADYVGDEAEKIEDAGYWFRNKVDAVLAEMMEGTGTYASLRSIEEEYPMTRNHKAKGKRGDWFFWGFRVVMGD